MKAYIFAELTVTEREWVSDYIATVTELVQQHGGHFLARTPKVDQLEGDGDVPQVVSIIEFPSNKAAISFYYSPEYRPFMESRKNGSYSRLLLIAGEDFAQA